MNKSIISVVIPVYNVPNVYLNRCLKSLIKQTFKDIEIIIVDDGSTDDSGVICDNFMRRDTRMMVYHIKNGGLSNARNFGVSKAKGKWISFVDGDDYLEDDAFARIMNHKIPSQCEMIFFGISRNENSKIFPVKICDKFGVGTLLRQEDLLPLRVEYLKFNASLASVYGKLFLKEFILSNSLEHNVELRQGSEGIEFNFRVLEKARNIMFLNEHVYHYVHNPNSISTCSTKFNDECVLFGFSLIKNQIIKDENCEVLLNQFYNRMIYVIVTTAISGIFHPLNKYSFKDRKNALKNYLNQQLIKETIKTDNIQNIDWKRKVVYVLIKHRSNFLLLVLAKLRYWRKNR